MPKALSLTTIRIEFSAQPEYDKVTIALHLARRRKETRTRSYIFPDSMQVNDTVRAMPKLRMYSQSDEWKNMTSIPLNLKQSPEKTLKKERG